VTTPADLAANDARIARRNARLQGIREGKAVDPVPTPSAHLHRLRREADEAAAVRAAEAAELAEEQARAARREKRSTPKKAEKA